MVEYICKRCNKVYSKKSHYVDHINRKFPCVAVNNGVSEQPAEVQQDAEHEQPKKEYKCEECNKTFTRKDALKRHTGAKICKKYKKDVIDEIKQMRIEFDELKRNNNLITNNTNNTTNNTINNKNMLVEIYFDIGNVNYKIIRGIKPKHACW
jgi:protein-arginine kinase activator protein McsA